MDSLKIYFLILLVAVSLASNYKLNDRINQLEESTPKVLTLDYARVLSDMSKGLNADVEGNANLMETTLEQLKSMGYVVIDSRMVFSSPEMSTLTSDSFLNLAE